jgi:UDP-N-acetylglucosamine--N-acetylmuramyl-(pentapeptide) pyrophosphoryl-undecaprenol N-acetylglucosamine transferase
MRILFTGGGTGGHIFPIIAVMRAFDWTLGYQFYYLGPDSFVEKNLPNKSMKIKFISAGKFRRYFSLETFFDLIKIFIGLIQSFWQLFVWMPDVIFSKGGYGSFPVVLAGWFYRIPIVLHESDSVPGLANRILARFARRVILSWPGSEQYFGKYRNKLVLIGNPVRNELTQGVENQGRRLFKISSNKPVILILGGSQGAQKINEEVVNTLPRLLQIAEVIHISGKENFKFVEQETEKSPNYHLYPFLDVEQLKHALAVADLIVNRAGAGSIAEISAVGKPSILIPIPDSAQDHQRQNAYKFAEGGQAVVLDQENLTPNLFLDTISNLLSNPAKLKQMGQKAKTFYNYHTPERIRDEILKFIT